MIRINDLSILINNKPIVQHISCIIKKGCITGFIGPSGAGKTSILKTIAGLIKHSEGSITINGENIDALSPSQRTRTIGYVFQQFNLFPHLTVLYNCTNPLIAAGMCTKEAEDKARYWLEKLGMSSYNDSYPATLSGGQQQRVALARALSLEPSFLLLDEPTASLDPANTQILVNILYDLKKQGITILYSSQDSTFINSMLDHVYYIENGKILDYGDTKKACEQSPYIQRYLGK